MNDKRKPFRREIARLALGLGALTAICGATVAAHADDKASGKGLVIGWSQRGIRATG